MQKEQRDNPFLLHQIQKLVAASPLRHLVLDLSHSKYEVIRAVGRKILGEVRADDSKAWDIAWSDSPHNVFALSGLEQHQRINHFPGMQLLGRKNLLGRSLARVKRICPEDWGFVPDTWMLPFQGTELLREAEKYRTLIVKPEASCQGRGIFLCSDVSEIQPNSYCVVQQYIDNPLLIDGLKFDLRIYALVTGCDPLRILVFREGLGRFSTEVYSKPTRDNLANQFMHLTNYAINKHSSKFKSQTQHKRTLASVFATLQSMGINTETLWDEIKKIVAQTLIAIQGHLRQDYRVHQPDNLSNDLCFELLGFDIILDGAGRPHLLEVNQMPSLSVESPVDAEVKVRLIYETLLIVGLTEEQKKARIKRKRISQRKRVFTGKKLRLSEEAKAVVRQEFLAERVEREARSTMFQLAYPASQQALADKFQRITKYCENQLIERIGTNIIRSRKYESAAREPEVLQFVPSKINTKEMLENIYRVRPKKPGALRLRKTTEPEKRTEIRADSCQQLNYKTAAKQ